MIYIHTIFEIIFVASMKIYENFANNYYFCHVLLFYFTLFYYSIFFIIKYSSFIKKINSLEKKRLLLLYHMKFLYQKIYSKNRIVFIETLFNKNL